MIDEPTLAAELHALRARDYAAEGIPMIVAAEAVGTLSPVGDATGVADAFHALALALAEAGAEVSAATVLEMIAARELCRLDGNG